MVDHFSHNINQKEELSQQLEILATTDKLTGVYNRYKWDQVLSREMARMDRNEFDLSLIMFDIDFFKSINDRFGHDVGDIFLKAITKIVKDQIRRIDLFFRLGGEEFAILALDTKLEHALTIAEKIRESIEHYRFNHNEKVTISLDVTQYKQNDNIGQFIKKADLALYNAKESGRNCIRQN